MKLNIEQQHLQQLLSRVIGVTPKRVTIPILANVKLTAADGYLKAVATDLDMEISTKVPADVEQPGETTVIAAMLSAIAAKMPKEKLVSVQANDQYLHVKSGRTKFKLATLDAADFPVFSAENFDASLTFDGEALRNALEKTVWAASTEETRYYLQGVAMQNREGATNFIATDGHRLAWYRVGNDGDFPDVIIPTDTVRQMISAIEDDAATLDVSQTKVRLTYGDTTISSKIIDGQYPDWTRVLPKDNPNSVSLSSLEAKAAIDRVTIVATDRTRAVRFGVSGGDMTLTVQDQTGGSATEVLTVEQDGENVEIGLNSRYALDAFAQADKGDVTINYGSSMNAILVKYDKEPELTAVVMPTRF